MTNSKAPLERILERRGIDNVFSYLAGTDLQADISKSNDPDVRVRGSVFLMLGALISRRKIEKGLDGLKYL